MQGLDRALLANSLSDSFAVMRQKLAYLLEEVDSDKGGAASFATSRSRQRRMIQDIWDARQSLLALESGEEPFKHSKGLHLRGFRSDVDDSLQCYQIYVPSSYSKSGEGGPPPLVIMCPTATSIPRPFVNSLFIKDHELSDRIAQLAEKHGVIFVWAGYHNQPAGLPMESVHLDEVLNAVSREYNYDPSRIVLMGSCSAAVMAFNAAASWPGRFAGLALLDPEFAFDTIMPEKLVSVFSKQKGFRKWYMDKPGINAFMQRKAPPLYIVNDGGYSGHGDWKSAAMFAERAKKDGAPVELALRAQTQLQHLGAWDELIGWAAKQRNENNQDEPCARTRRNSIQDVLAERFWIVQGTAGSAGENNDNAQVVRAIRDAWEQTHFSPCSVVKDTELTLEQRQTANLVLVGNAATNTVWNTFAEKAGIEITPEGITFDKQFWHGGSIVIQAMTSNPLNTEKRIVFIGGNNLKTKACGTLNLSRDGWFRYAIWDADARLLGAFVD